MGREPKASGIDMDANDIIERRACITGVGQSEIGRRLYRDPLELTLDGCLAAIADAGLTTADIDGLSTYPGPMGTPACTPSTRAIRCAEACDDAEPKGASAAANCATLA